jgi:hypothetical protein
MGACPPTKENCQNSAKLGQSNQLHFLKEGGGLHKFVIVLVVGNQIKTWVIKTNTLGNGSSANPSNPNTNPIAKRLSMLFLFPILVGSPFFLSSSL